MDATLADKWLARIVDCVQQLRTFARPEMLCRDPVQLGFAIYTLQTAVQAAVNAEAVVAGEQLPGGSGTDREGSTTPGWNREGSADTWRRILTIRDLVRNGHLDVDPAMVKTIVESHLDDLLAFVRAIRTKAA